MSSKRSSSRNQRSQFAYENLEARQLLAADLILSEMVASNLASFEDGYGDDPDWIELHNAGDAPIDLAGHYLSDDPGNPTKWQFPVSRILQPGAFEVVFASSRNEIDPAGFVHTNFSLSAGGEYLGLSTPLGVTISEFGNASEDYPPQIRDISYGVSQGTLVKENSVGQYWLPSNGSLGTTWTSNSFDASANGFNDARVSIGYENNPGSGTSYSDVFLTEVPSGTIGAYVRVDFEIDDASAIDDLTLSLKYDDGVGVYLNGTLLFSRNAGNGLTWNSTASTFHDDVDALQFTEFGLDGSAGSEGDFLNLLVDGQNTLAIHALNESAGSSDFLLVPRLTSDSIGGLVSYLETPTPGMPNSPTVTLGPTISSVTPNGTTVSDGQPLTISAAVSEFDRPVDSDSVRLRYRVMYGNEVELTMRDDGTGGDQTPGDGIYSATIPGSAMSAGEMVRWFVSASDDVGNLTREPRFFDPLDSAEYFGTVVTDPTVDTDLPVFQWFVVNTNSVNTDAGSRSSLFYNGEFYDNIQTDIHGQSTRLPEFIKKSYDFDANSGDKFLLTSESGRHSDFNLLTNYADQTKIRHPLAYEITGDAGTPSHLAFSVMVYRNGSFYGTFDIVEEGDEEFLERVGLDPLGALYKVDNALNDAFNNVDKRSRDWEDRSDFIDLVEANSRNGNDARIWDYDNLDVAATVNYLATQTLIGNIDHGFKNYYMYIDTEGTGLWEPVPWDLDLTFGHRWNANVSPPYFDNTLFTTNTLTPGFNNLFQRIYSDPRMGPMYWRRLQSLTDQYFGTPSSDVTDSWAYERMEELRLLTQNESVQDFTEWGLQANFAANYPFSFSQAIDQIQTAFLTGRRNFINNDGRTPSSQIGNPQIDFDDVDFDASPISGLQSEEYLRLNNPNNFSVDISNWSLSGGIDHVFSAGTVIPANSTLYVVAEVKGFLNRAIGPSSGQQLFIQGNYDGQMGSLETIELFSADGVKIDEFVTPEQGLTDNQQFLRIVEVNYNPIQDSDAEYIEFLNTSGGSESVTLVLDGVVITDGPSEPFVFPSGTSLVPGERIVVAKDPAVFALAYPNVDPSIVVGGYEGKLSNSGETIRLEEPGGQKIVEFAYADSDPWAANADGAGGSIQLVDELNTPIDLVDKYYSWRGSYRFGGTPGAPPASANAQVVINEVLAHSDLPVVDFIELKNLGASAIDVGGWYLSDDEDDLLQYQIPANTIIQAGGYLVLDENDFNAGGTGFALSSQGETVWLTTTLGGNVDRYVDVLEFGGTLNGQTLGRTPDGTGRLAPQLRPTPNAENSGAFVGPVTISEVNYHPDAPTPADLAIEPSLTEQDLEFIEIHNAALSTVDLTGWRVQGEVDFVFGSTSLGPQSTLVLVTFDPDDAGNSNRTAAFRNHYGIDGSVLLVGAPLENLSNNYGRIELQRTDLPGYPMVDEVLYDDRGPWPDADGNGDSLQRIDGTGVGNSVLTWQSAVPSPGQVVYATVTPVVVVESNVLVVEGDSATQQVAVTVSLTQPDTDTIQVDFASTVAAIFGAPASEFDFEDVAGTLEFLPGEVSKTIVVDVYGDRFAEQDENFALELSNPVNADIAGLRGNVTIVNDDSFALGVIVDFGTVESPIATNAIGYVDEPYSAELGLGWTNTVAISLVERSRGTSLVRDLATTRNSEFAVDVPNGDYVVTAYFGVINRVDVFQVIVEGTAYSERFGQGPNVTATYSATVTDGQLTFSINGGGGLDNTARISGLKIEEASGRSSAQTGGKNLLSNRFVPHVLPDWQFDSAFGQKGGLEGSSVGLNQELPTLEGLRGSTSRVLADQRQIDLAFEAGEKVYESDSLWEEGSDQFDW